MLFSQASDSLGSWNCLALSVSGKSHVVQVGEGADRGSEKIKVKAVVRKAKTNKIISML